MLLLLLSLVNPSAPLWLAERCPLLQAQAAVTGALVLPEVASMNEQVRLMGEPDQYEPAARDLARLAQSDIRWPNDLRPEFWLPESLRRLRPVHASIEPDEVHVTMGNGHRHWGYKLLLDAEGSTNERSRWRLLLYDEPSGDELLVRFDVDRGDAFTRREWVDETVPVLDRLIADDPIGDHFAAKVRFLLEYEGPEAARAAVAAALREYPDHGWPNLAAALIGAARGDAGGAERLVAFAERAPGFSRWLRVADYHRLRDEPAKAEEALRRAIDHPLVPDPDERWRVEARAYPLALYLLERGRFEAVAALADAVLATPDAGLTERYERLKLRAAAREPGGEDADARLGVAEPLGNIDLDHLVGEDPTR